MPTTEQYLTAFEKWLASSELSAHAIAKKAGISPSVIYNLRAGRAKTLSLDTLDKIAKAAGTTVENILTGTENPSSIEVVWRVGVGGSMFAVEDGARIAAPAGVPGRDLAAAEIDGDALHPLPGGWHVLFEREAIDPEQLVGKLAIVRWSGGGDRPAVRTIRRGSRPGLYSLAPFFGPPLEDVEIRAAHEVVAIVQGKPAAG